MSDSTQGIRRVLSGLETDFEDLRQYWRDDVARLFETSQIQPLVAAVSALERSCAELEAAMEGADRLT